MLEASAALAYRRRASPLHAARATVAAAYGFSLALAALLLEDPVLLASLLGAVLLAAAGAGVARRLLGAARVMVVPVLVLSVAVNVLASRQGLTVFARLGEWGPLGQVDLTVEAAVYGAMFALRLLVVSLACLLVVCAADPDELLGALRRISPRSALTAALATRMLPVLGRDARRLAEAQRCRPDAPRRGGRLAILAATVSGALERSLDVAAVLEMRGYGSSARAARGAGVRRSRHDLAFAAAALSLPVLALLARESGAAGFRAYPLVSLTLTPATFAFAAAMLAVALAPFADRRGIEL